MPKIGSTGLRFRLVLYVLLPLFALSGGLGFIALQHFENVVRERMELDVRVVSRTFQPVLGSLLSDEHPERLQPLLRQAFEAEGDYGVFVYDRNGSMVARAGRFQHGELTIESLAPDDRQSRAGGYSEAADESVYSYFAPLITDTGGIVGMLQVARLRRDYEDFLTNLRLGALVFFLLSALTLVGVAAVGFRRAIGSPLNRLNRSMLKIRSGQRDHRAAPQGPREVAALANTLNEMLDSIERAEKELLNQREKEQKLSEQLKRSEQLASLGNIAAGVAHELGTPLSVVVGNAQRGLRQPGNPPKTEKALQDIRIEVERMDRIVRELLEFGRAGNTEARTMTPEKLAQCALGSVESVREETGGTIELGKILKDRTVFVNPVRVELALINLLKNALQCRPGSTVRFSCEADGRNALFEIADNGPGLDEELQQKIFEPFFSTKGPDRGVGLGLAIVAQVADECGGEIRVRSRKGDGARFFLSIPFAGADQ